MDYIRAKSIAAFDVWGAWGASGARSAKSYVAKQCQIPYAEAGRQLRRGHLLCHRPKVDEAWSRGEITKDHVDRIGRARNPRTEDFLERDEDMLLDKAIDNTFPDFERIVDYWSQHADPDGAEEDAMEQRARRDVYLVPSVGGTFLGKMTLDPISGAIVSGELGRLERELFESDWAKAQDELGRDPTVDELGRTSAQRRADALVEMATPSGTAPADWRPRGSHLSVAA